MNKEEKKRIPRAEESRVIGDIRRLLPDLWTDDALLITVRRTGRRLRVEPLRPPSRQEVDIKRVD